MKITSTLLGLALLLGGAAPLLAESLPTVKPAVTYQTEIDDWAKARDAWWRNPDGYLSLTALYWLSDTPRSYPGIGEAHLVGQDVVLKFEDGVTVDGKPVKEYRVTPDMPRNKPDFRKGDGHFYVNRHGKKIGIRAKSPNSPILARFQSMESFPVDPNWRIVGRFEADTATIPVASVVDETTSEASPGYAVFERDGKSYKLRLMGAESDPAYFLVFSDETAGKTTYSACRFLDVEKAADGSLILDFNKSENPPCSVTPYATCPLPPQGNVLPFEIPAGEKVPPTASHH